MKRLISVIACALCATSINAATIHVPADQPTIQAWVEADQQQDAPHIISTSPTQNELNVPVSTNISVTFDTDMDEATINDSTFVVNARSTGLHLDMISYDSLTRIAAFDPDDDFAVGEVVTVVLTTCMESSGGVPLNSSYVWSFTVVVDGGSGSFASQSLYSVGNSPHSIFVADVNGDGNMDIVTANSSSNDISVLLNNGDGTYGTHSIHPVENHPRSVFAADVYENGSLDLVTADVDSDNISVLPNYGGGTFGEHLVYSVGNSPHSIFLADVNGDGHIDAVTANQDSDNISVLRNDGEGAFTDHSVYSVGDGSYSVIAADLDNNGSLDVVTSDFWDDSISILLNAGDGTFILSATYSSVGHHPYSTVAADIDRDGDLDIATVNGESANITILFNNEGSFSFHSTYVVGQNPWSVFTSDFDGDGDLDLAVAASDISVLLNQGDGTFSPHAVYGSGLGCISVYGGDLDGDGDVDLVGAKSSGTVAVLLNEGIPSLVLLLSIQDELALTNVVNHSPTYVWEYDTSDGFSQAAFEIAVGVDTDWSYAEMWNPAVFEAPDTFVTYAGAPLLDGETYYLRLRLRDTGDWKGWYETSFRMNSVPSVPTPLHPSGGEYANDLPILWVLNSTDTEGDTLTYDFSGVHDTDCVAPTIDLTGVPETPDSTGGQVIESLGESCIYWWKARAFDGYEYSEWSSSETFIVNATPEPPLSFQALYPPDTGGLPVFNMLTEFWWERSYDPDPLDTVRYRLEIAVDSDFTFVLTIDSIEDESYTMIDSLTFSTHYWWRVTAFDNTSLSTMSSNTPDFWTWTLGDLDHSHAVNIADLTRMVDFLFFGGQPIYPLFIGDVDGNCSVNVADLTYLVEYLFFSGPAPRVGCG